MEMLRDRQAHIKRLARIYDWKPKRLDQRVPTEYHYVSLKTKYPQTHNTLSSVFLDHDEVRQLFYQIMKDRKVKIRKGVYRLGGLKVSIGDAKIKFRKRGTSYGGWGRNDRLYSHYAWLSLASNVKSGYVDAQLVLHEIAHVIHWYHILFLNMKDRKAHGKKFIGILDSLAYDYADQLINPNQSKLNFKHDKQRTV